jgi:hypothetical protein
VTDRDNATNNILHITGNGHLKNNTLGLELQYNGYSDNRGSIFTYDRVNGLYKGLRLEGSDLIINAAVDGNVGIGTTSPAYKLDVAGQAHASNGFSTSNAEGLHISQDNGYICGWNNASNIRTGFLQFNSGYDVTLNAENNNSIRFATGIYERMRISDNGNVGIGTANPQSELAVKGTITSKKVKVTQDGWADYVFDSSYQLAPLHQVEKYIQRNKHLPDVPSAAEVKKDGVDLGDNQVVLLKKIEELTLYIIEQNKKLESLSQQVKLLQENKK